MYEITTHNETHNGFAGGGSIKASEPDCTSDFSSSLAICEIFGRGLQTFPHHSVVVGCRELVTKMTCKDGHATGSLSQSIS